MRYIMQCTNFEIFRPMSDGFEYFLYDDLLQLNPAYSYLKNLESVDSLIFSQQFGAFFFDLCYYLFYSFTIPYYS